MYFIVYINFNIVSMIINILFVYYNIYLLRLENLEIGMKNFIGKRINDLGFYF